ncbi:MOSC domain-containing protein, partial [Pseudomonas aeruginosa]|nr:MOSC domain-containing protein [Pseudomonas aeruginosa]MCW5399399.1 MOSC domain-containing protein [Pseudomonas aeruginosa]MCW5504529.1 MOSC domain-containing protein [Pseudomonas aeruginosa]
MSEGRVKWIGVRSGSRAPIQELEA